MNVEKVSNYTQRFLGQADPKLAGNVITLGSKMAALAMDLIINLDLIEKSENELNKEKVIE